MTFKNSNVFIHCRMYSTYMDKLNAFMMRNEKLRIHQQSLPRLPVPLLYPSLKTYLRTVQPFLSADEYRTTSKIVKEFDALDGPGSLLYSKVIEKAVKYNNWLDEWWINTAYLEFRKPLICYSSTGTFIDIKLNTLEDQLQYAAKTVVGILQYNDLINKYAIPFQEINDQPLDMTQHYKIFHTCRIPGHPKDHLEFYGFDDKKPNHIIVVHNNQFFSLTVSGNDGKLLNENQILAQLEMVVSKSQNVGIPVGILSTLDRSKWAQAYERLQNTDSANVESIKTIQSSIFILCLDQSPTEGSQFSRIHYGAHGGGPQENGGNRWYDKALNFIVGRNSSVGTCLEHATSGGEMLEDVLTHVFYYHKQRPNKVYPAETAVPEPNKLEFILSNETLEDIEEAKRDLERLSTDYDLECFKYENYGKTFVKLHDLSPDAFIQMALQLTFCKLHKEIPATYESASTRKFLNGVTDTIRSTSIESISFCKEMIDLHSSASSKYAALQKANKRHKDYTFKAVNGGAIDRLLLGLKKVAEEINIPTPEIFLDPAFSRSSYFRLSTSQVRLKYDYFHYFGPVVVDGYGCYYNPKANSISFAVSAYTSCPETSAKSFQVALEESLDEMKIICNERIVRSECIIKEKHEGLSLPENSTGLKSFPWS